MDPLTYCLYKERRRAARPERTAAAVGSVPSEVSPFLLGFPIWEGRGVWVVWGMGRAGEGTRVGTVQEGRWASRSSLPLAPGLAAHTQPSAGACKLLSYQPTHRTEKA